LENLKSKHLNYSLFRIKRRELTEVLGEINVLLAHSRQCLSDLNKIVDDIENVDVGE